MVGRLLDIAVWIVAIVGGLAAFTIGIFASIWFWRSGAAYLTMMGLAVTPVVGYAVGGKAGASATVVYVLIGAILLLFTKFMADSGLDGMASPVADSQVRRRGAITRHVKETVWRRDEGACVACGSTDQIQFDHVIPHSLGGADTAENLQLLCARCNRAKGASFMH